MLKFVNYDVVFQEIPDETTLSINISNCPCHCPGCHSTYLADDIGEPLTPQRLEQLVGSHGQAITCVCFMGGDAAPAEVDALAAYLRRAHGELKVGWYSGRIRLSAAIHKAHFDYIKLGPYLRHLGPLNARTTNQRMYRRTEGDVLEDITPRFWRS